MTQDAPNLMLIVVDCLRADRLTGEGGEAVTPFLNEAVERGVLFETTISVNSFTLPCMTSYLTGKYPFRHGLRLQSAAAGRLRDEHRLLPEWLKQAGYHTYAWIGGAVGREHGFDRGIDAYAHGHRSASFQEHFGPAVIEDLQAGRLAEPWFVYVHILDVHEPRIIAPEFNHEAYGRHPYDRALSSLDPWLRRTVDAAGGDTVVAVTGDHGEGLGTSVKAQALERGRWLRGPVHRLLRTVLKPWWHRIGPRITKAKQRVMLSRGDPENIRGHGWACYDVHTRVPLLLLNVPGAAARRVTQMVRTVDFTPTVLDLLGAGGWQSAGMDGVSLRPALEGQTLPPLEAYVENTQGHTGDVPLDQWRMAVRTDTAKYICSPFAEDPREELFDLAEDPGETRNLAAESPDRAREMRRRLEAVNPEVATGEFGTGAGAIEALTDEDQAAVEQRLRDLGYID